MDSPRHVIKRILNPSFLSGTASHNVASTIRQSLPRHVRRQPARHRRQRAVSGDHHGFAKAQCEALRHEQRLAQSQCPRESVHHPAREPHGKPRVRGEHHRERNPRRSRLSPRHPCSRRLCRPHRHSPSPRRRQREQAVGTRCACRQHCSTLYHSRQPRVRDEGLRQHRGGERS
jgi:hypothetical protein